MGSLMSKFCACIFCCCPAKNCHGRERRKVEIIYNNIKQIGNMGGWENEQRDKYLLYPNLYSSNLKH